MAAKRTPAGLGRGGAALWRAVMTDYSIDALQEVTLLEACRAKDRLDKLDELLRGDIDVWTSITHRTQTQDYELKIDAALSAANATANLFKQLIASLRLPDVDTGKRPQQRGGGRGAYTSSSKGDAKVSSLEAARIAATTR